MKLKKLSKTFLSLFLAFNMLMPMSNVNFYSGNAYAAEPSQSAGFSPSGGPPSNKSWTSTIVSVASTVGSFFGGCLSKLFQDAFGNLASRLIESTGIFDFDTWFIFSRYGENLVESAKEGKIHDCVERDKEIDNLLQVLLNEDKGNAIITGAAGVGKTALIEGLAYRIAKGDVPEYFKNKKIIRINMVALIAGDTYTGSEKAMARMRAMLKAAESDPDVILFIDEFHQIVNMNAAQLFKTYVERNRVKMIAATTTSEYEYIRIDEALVRRFQEVIVNEPSKYQMMKILNGLKPDIEKKYNIKITNDAISATIEYTDRYMKNKTFPDKALNVIYNVSKIASTNNEQIQKDGKAMPVPIVTRNDVISAISRDVRIPLGEITPKEQEFLDSMEQRVESIVVGQHKAVKKLCGAVRNSRSGVRYSERPNSSLFFTGTSGVGKSKLAQVVGNEIDGLIEIDFSDYTESDAIKRLLNSKIFGYNGGLAEKISRKPYSVVLFDNLEKAHPNTIKSIVSILKKGYILDAKGNEVDFRNAFIVINSKIGEEEMLSCDSCTPTDEVIEKINQKIINHFGEDFFDSLDDVVVFNKLDKDSMSKITDVILDTFENILSDKNIRITVTKEVRDYIYNMPIDDKLGSTSFDRFLSKNIFGILNKAMINKKIKENSSVSYVLNNGKIELKVE